MDDFEHPRLVADIGSRVARFALQTAPGRFEQGAQLPCADHADLDAAVRAYLARQPAARPEHAAIAVANPVDGDGVRMTNSPWAFSIEALRQRLSLQTLVVVNDFTALAMALPRLQPAQRRQVGGGQARERSVIGLLGAGTGLGVSALVPAHDGWVALGAEGGHASFAPRDEREIAILRHALQRHGHVSNERLLSGPGLELIHAALREHAGRPAEALAAPEITRRALAGEDATCTETLQAFSAMLGSAAGNLALTLGATGGVYLGGGIVPRLGDWFDRSPFRARFEDKGRFGAYLRAVPTFVVSADDATLVGAAAILSEQLRARAAPDAAGLLGQIRRSRPSLTPAGRRVADHVLAQPRAALTEPIAHIARDAGVSQPTVIRFCRALGCSGLSDFKLRLAAGLTGTVPLAHAQVGAGDTALERAEKLLGNAAGALLQLRERLQREPLERATRLLAAAARVDCYAAGDAAAVAAQAQLSLLRAGVACAALTDARAQRLAAPLLRPGDAALIIDSGEDGLLALADVARARGAAVLAITATPSALAQRADVVLTVEAADDASAIATVAGRLGPLLLVESLAASVAAARSR